MTSIFADMNEIATLADKEILLHDDGERIEPESSLSEYGDADQDNIDYTLIMDVLADMNKTSTGVLKDVIGEIQAEIESRPDLDTAA